MQFELIFKGTPAEFGIAVVEIDRGFIIGGARYPPEGFGKFSRGALRPDANPVTAHLFLDNDIEGGLRRRVEIRAHKLPNGRTRLTGHVDDHWPEALMRWKNVLEELSSQGWVERDETILVEEEDNSKPWERIPDKSWDRQALEMWCGHRTCGEIGQQIDISEGRVRNRLTELRNKYGMDVVPTDEQRRKSRIRKRRDDL